MFFKMENLEEKKQTKVGWFLSSLVKEFCNSGCPQELLLLEKTASYQPLHIIFLASTVKTNPFVSSLAWLINLLSKDTT